MSVLRKLKSLLGVDDGDDEADRDVNVTVEHDPENEAAVKGAEVQDSSADETDSSAGEDSTGEPSDETDESTDADDGAGDEGTTDAVEIPDAEAPTGEEADADESEAAESSGDDAEESTDDSTDESAAGEPVDVLSGIGPAYAQRLGDAGIDSVDELAAADAAELSDATEIAEGRVQNWIDQAAEY